MASVTFIRGVERLKQENAILHPPDPSGAFLAEVEGRTKEELLEYLDSFARGTLQIMVDGKAYRVTEFRSDGQFKAEP